MIHATKNKTKQNKTLDYRWKSSAGSTPWSDKAQTMQMCRPVY